MKTGVSPEICINIDELQMRLRKEAWSFGSAGAFSFTEKQAVIRKFLRIRDHKEDVFAKAIQNQKSCILTKTAQVTGLFA